MTILSGMYCSKKSSVNAICVVHACRLPIREHCFCCKRVVWEINSRKSVERIERTFVKREITERQKERNCDRSKMVDAQGTSRNARVRCRPGSRYHGQRKNVLKGRCEGGERRGATDTLVASGHGRHILLLKRHAEEGGNCLLVKQGINVTVICHYTWILVHEDLHDAVLA